MESYEKLNKLLEPVDTLWGMGQSALEDLGLYNKVKHGFQGLAKLALYEQFSRMYGLEVEGELPEKGGIVLAVNHQSWLDVQLLWAVSNRKLTFMAKAVFKDWPLMRRLVDLTDAVYITRGGDREGMKNAVEALKRGEVLVIFPEGTIPGEEDIPRWEVEPDTGLLPGKTGAVRVALEAGVPIIPCGLSGTGKAFPPEAYPRMEISPLPSPVKLTVRFGRPIELKKPKRVTGKWLHKRTHEMMKSISNLVDHDRGFVSIQLPVSKKITPDNLPEMAYQKGPRKEGTKDPVGVLVLHGFTSHIHCVDPLLPGLDAMGVPYRFPILKGHGTRPEDMENATANDWYDDAENALLDLFQDAEKIIVIGLSMGGAMALDLAAYHRDKVAGVVGIAAAVKVADPLAPLSPLLAGLVRFWPSPRAFNDKALEKKENKNYKKFSTKAFASLYRYIKGTKNRLSFIKAPILILQSRKDTVISPDSARIIYEKVSSRDKTIVWFEKTNHEMLLDMEHDKVIKTVLDFVKKIVDSHINN